MGLDISPASGDGPTAHWSYGGFHDLRCWLAQQDGIDLPAMAGFTDHGLPWENVTTDLAPLLNHSDCDGELTAEECMQVLPRLKEIRLGLSSSNAAMFRLDPLIDVITHCAAVSVSVDFH